MSQSEKKKFFGVAKKLIHELAVPVPSGSFSTALDEEGGLKIEMGFHYCRDLFHPCTKKMKMLLFMCDEKAANVAAFLNAIECKLGNKEITLCGPTNYKK